MERQVLLDGEALSLFEGMSGVAVRPDEVERWKALIRKHQYLGLRHLVGETIHHVAEVKGHAHSSVAQTDGGECGNAMCRGCSDVQS